MSNIISSAVWAREELNRELGIESLGFNERHEEIKRLEGMAYEKNTIHLIIDCGNVDVNTVNIGDLEYGEDGDYDILTSTGRIELNDEYMQFDSQKEYEEYLEENEIEDAPDWWDFAETSETCWNVFFRFNDMDIDIDVANEIGLPVISLNKSGETYVSISGCGMDLSFQIMEYQALALGRLEEKYVNKSKLDWAKMNMSEDRFKSMLEHLGVDVDRIDNDYYTK